MWPNKAHLIWQAVAIEINLDKIPFYWEKTTTIYQETNTRTIDVLHKGPKFQQIILLSSQASQW